MNNKYFVKMCFVCILICNSKMYCQVDDGEGPPVPPAAAPINDWLPYMVIIALLFAGILYFKIAQNKKINN